MSGLEMRFLPSPDKLIDSAATGWDLFVGDGLADEWSTPSSIVDEGPQRLIRRYRSRRTPRADRAPVLLVPPLAAPAKCFDLRAGCSVAEHLTALGYPTYLVDYGPISFSDRALGIEHWVDDVLPATIQTVSEDAGGAPVQPLGWCLGGIMALLAAAARPELPIASLALVGSPFDFAQVRMMTPIRRLSELTGGAFGTALYRMLGGAPAPLVGLGFRLTAYDRYLTRPLFLARNLHDRETIAHSQAIDRYMASMLAYPGRTFGQLYHAFFRVNDLADGRIALAEGREIDVADVRQPVLAVAGASDVLAPEGAVHHVGKLLTGAAEVELETAPGGHLGVLAGRSAPGTTWAHLDRFLARHEPSGAQRPASVEANLATTASGS